MQASWHSVGMKVAVFKYILPIKHIYHYARQEEKGFSNSRL